MKLFQRFRLKINAKQSKKIRHFVIVVFSVILFLLLYFFSALSNLRVFLPYYTDISGWPFSSKNYLVIFQNNNELRPAGGFISAYGLAQFRNGFLTGFNVEDVYGSIDEHAYVEPPYPMKKLLANAWYKGYTFRDANFEADFPKTAEALVRFFHMTKPDIGIDGVIAINYSFLENLLRALGPIEINGITFSADTLFETLEYQVNNIDRHNLTELKNRKNILGDFARALKRKIILSPLKLRRVSDTILHSLATKEIQLFFTNTSLQKLVIGQKWSGAWQETFGGDFLALVSANFGGMKSDRYIKREVKYHFKINENPATGKKDLIGDVTVNLDHYGIENIPLSGKYSGFLRVYVPRGAVLLDITPEYQKDLWQKDDGLLHIFGNIVNLNPGQKTQLHYRYLLPATILDNNNYTLYIPSQSGTDEDYYTIIVEAPQGNHITKSSLSEKENFGIYKGKLTGDLNIGFTLSPDSLPPQVVYQGVKKTSVIVINFNEQIAGASVIDPLNYNIKDLNIKHPDKNDQITIDRIEHNGKSVSIYVNGMTPQSEESYRLTMKNIYDTHNNVINPNPKNITVVQRE